ncbi:VCBS domain-containing protein [Methylobacterium sp. DCY52]|jgi:VCBS repeat-containing protein|uniref:VCBS domain-containing protein n=1 Tax=Methylobacterium sp. DCY52 TaxID=739139 RepID=UPI003144FC3B
MSDSSNTNPSYLIANQIVGNGPVDLLTSKYAWAFKGEKANAWTDRDISVGKGEDGDSIVFASFASNLTGGNYSDKEHIFLRDTQFGFTTLVTPSDANGASYQPVISRDGKKVAYISRATNIVNGDTNDRPDLFVKDVSWEGNGLVQRVDTGWNGKQGYGDVLYPALSPDGSKIAFCYSDSSILDGTDLRTWHVYVKDLVTGNLSRISEDASHKPGNGDSVSPLAWSADGTRLAFISEASNLVGGDTNGAPDLFVKYFSDGHLNRVATNVDRYHGLAFDPNDNNFLAFSSELVHGDSSKHTDVLIENLNTGIIDRASLDRNNNELNGDSFGPSFSEDGQTLFFATSADIGNVGDSNKHINIYAKDRHSKDLTLLSSASDGTPGDGNSYPVLASPKLGDKVYFASTSSNLAANDGGTGNDIFARTIRSTDTIDIHRADFSKYGAAWKYGSLLFTDPDRDDTHTVSVAKADGDLGNLFADVRSEPNGGYGAVGWRYRLLAEDFKKLAAGTTKDDTFTVTIDDGHGGVESHDVTVHLHAPDATSAASVSVQESHGLTGLEV